MTTNISLTFVNASQYDEDSLFPEFFGDDESLPTAVEAPLMLKTFVQRFRYRGKRESAKWNTFLISFNSDYDNIKNSLDRIGSSFTRSCNEYIESNNVSCCLTFARRQAIEHLKEG